MHIAAAWAETPSSAHTEALYVTVYLGEPPACLSPSVTGGQQSFKRPEVCASLRVQSADASREEVLRVVRGTLSACRLVSAAKRCPCFVTSRKPLQKLAVENVHLGLAYMEERSELQQHAERMWSSMYGPPYARLPGEACRELGQRARHGRDTA